MENHCPTCSGTGRKTITVSTFGEKTSSSVEISCMDCDGGKSPLTLVQAKILTKHKEEQAKLWCSCGNPSENASYVADGVSSKCRKHHWTCNDCGKILQVG